MISLLLTGAVYLSHLDYQMLKVLRSFASHLGLNLSRQGTLTEPCFRPADAPKSIIILTLKHPYFKPLFSIQQKIFDFSTEIA